MFTLSDLDLARILIRMDYARDHMARDHACRKEINEAEEILLEAAQWSEGEAYRQKRLARRALERLKSDGGGS